VWEQLTGSLNYLRRFGYPLLSLLSFKKDCKGDIMFLLQRPTLGSTLLSLEVHSQWFALDLGPGELATIALALENPHCIVLLDDAAARRIAQAAKLQVWGTLKILLEAKAHGLTERIAPVLEQSSDSAKSRIVSSSYKGCTNALRRNHEARNVQRLSA
jgi:hypothetical protein